MSQRKYTLLYVPDNGLFFDGGAFLDGHRQRISWNGTIPVYDSHSAAEVAKNKILAKYPNEYAGGKIVLLGIEIRGSLKYTIEAEYDR